MATVLQACEKVQDELDVWFQTCDAAELREPTPFFDFITSDLNNQGLSQQVNPGNGKVKTVSLRYFQRLSESAVLSNQANPNCVAVNEKNDNVEDYTIDPALNEQATCKLTLNDIATACVDNPDYIRQTINRLIDVLVRKIATKTATEAIALSGKWDSAVTGVVADQLTVRTTKSGAPEEVSPFTMQDIDVAMMQTGYCDNGFVFGGTALWKYYSRVLQGCCANQGVDLGAIAREFGKAVMYDRRIVSAFGDDNANIVTQAGSMALLTYSANQAYDGGINEMIGAGTNYFHTTIFDPASGLPMDLNIKDDCGTLHFVLTATTKLVALPSTLFEVGDSKEGVNFVNQILVNNA
jgi:hypothetical protein